MKKPRVNKTKQQIVDQIKADVKFKGKMKFVKEKFYPALCEATTSIDDASILLSGFNNVIMQEFLGMMKEKTVDNLNLVSKLDPASEKIEANKKLLALFDGMSVFDAKDYIEGMKSELALFQQEEMKSRPLSSLKVKWVDEFKQNGN